MKIISFTSGKGGVGKTSITCNVALSLAQQGKKVLLLDGDLGMSNIDIFFGVHPQKTLADVINNENIRSCLTSVANNVDLLAGGQGVQELYQLNAFQRREIINRLADMRFNYDFLLIDTAPGLHDYVLHLNAISDEIFVILTPDPSSFADAYALIKVLNQKHRTQNFSIICNQVKDEKQGAHLFLKFSEVIQQFLQVRVQYKCTVPYDPQLKMMNQVQRLIIRQDAQSASSKSIRALSSEIIEQSKKQEEKFSIRGSLDVLFRPVSGHA